MASMAFEESFSALTTYLKSAIKTDEIIRFDLLDGADDFI
jgi:hypothetical protein